VGFLRPKRAIFQVPSAENAQIEDAFSIGPSASQVTADVGFFAPNGRTCRFVSKSGEASDG